MPVNITPLPAQSVLLEMFRYCETTGILIRLSTGREVSGGAKSKYVVVGIGKETFLAHRLIWKMVTGDDAEIIDHSDCNGKNNRWENLREASQAENLRNRGAPKNNSSGVKGVSFCSATKLWRASITTNYRCVNLGRFPTIEEAAEVRRAASEKMHGEFSRAA